MSALRPLSGVIRTSASDCRTIAIYEYTTLEAKRGNRRRRVVAVADEAELGELVEAGDADPVRDIVIFTVRGVLVRAGHPRPSTPARRSCHHAR
jgi:hypothetical protein